MGFMEAIKAGLKGYVDFNGTAMRSEYWYFALFQILALIVASVVDYVVFGVPSFLYYAVSLALLLPGLAVAIRRLHDAGKTGWWLLISFVPLIGAIVLIVFLCQKSKLEDNKYR